MPHGLDRIEPWSSSCKWSVPHEKKREKTASRDCTQDSKKRELLAQDPQGKQDLAHKLRRELDAVSKLSAFVRTSHGALVESHGALDAARSGGRVTGLPASGNMLLWHFVGCGKFSVHLALSERLGRRLLGRLQVLRRRGPRVQRSGHK